MDQPHESEKLMNHATRLLLGTTALFVAVAASAAPTMPGQDGYHYSNGGTGYIGLTASAGQPRMNMDRTSMAAGEATTLINGRPNQNPEAPMPGSMTAKRAPQAWAQTQAMGNARNPAWGTPD